MLKTNRDLSLAKKDSFRVKEPIPVFGAAPTLIAALQVMETIKLIAGLNTLLTGKFVICRWKFHGIQVC